MQEQLDDLLHYLKAVWLKRRYILITMWLLCPIGWAFVTMLPNQYTAEARVYADTRSMLKPLLKGLALDTDPGQELALVVRTLLGRSNLEKIARASDMDIQASSEDQYQALLTSLKRDIKITQASGERLYTVEYSGASPNGVQQVVQAVLDVFVENTLGAKRLDSDQATEFINSQIEEYEQRLSQSEKRLADFKQEFGHLLPGSARGYYANLEQAQNQLEETRLALSEIQTRLNSARAQLASEEAVLTQTRQKLQTDYDDRLLMLQTRLDDLTLRFTDRHPDVIEMRRQIRALQEQQEQVLSSTTANTTAMRNSVIYQGLKINVSNLENELASLRVREARFAAKLEEWKARALQVPEVEAKLSGLNRNYQITKSKYEELLTRREQALISQSAGEATENIKFRVIDAPLVPSRPSGPARPLLVIGILFFSLVLGLAISFLISQVNPVVSSARQLYQQAGFPVFGVVSATAISGLNQIDAKKTRWFLIANLLLLCIFAIVFTANSIPEFHQQILNGLKKVGLV